MSKEEIKNLLLDFIVEYDPMNWSNKKVYDKFTEIFYQKFADLETKLAEKEKEIKSLRTRAFIDMTNIEMLELRELNRHQDKIEFAVEQLEKVKWIVEEKSMTQSPFGTQKIYASDVSGIIDNQIEELKKGVE